MGLLSSADAQQSKESFLKRLLWPSIESSDARQLGRQGLAVSFVAAFLVSFAVLSHPIVACLGFLFYALGALGIRQHSMMASILVALISIGNAFVNVSGHAISIIFGFCLPVLLLLNIRVTYVARAAVLRTHHVEHENEIDADAGKTVDLVPRRLWAAAQFIFVGIFLFGMARLIGRTMVLYRQTAGQQSAALTTQAPTPQAALSRQVVTSPKFKFGLTCKLPGAGSYDVFALLKDGSQPDSDPEDAMQPFSQNDENISVAEFAYYDSEGHFIEPFSFRSHFISDYNNAENEGKHAIYDFQWDAPYNLPYSIGNTLGSTSSNHVLISRTALTLLLPPASDGEPPEGFEGEYACTKLSDSETQSFWHKFRADLAAAQLNDAETLKKADRAAQKQKEDSINNKPI